MQHGKAHQSIRLFENDFLERLTHVHPIVPLLFWAPVVVWLLWRYRLQSDSGPGSLVIDVDGLQSTDQTVLKKAMDEVGLLGQVRARIKGIIQRRGDTSYHLAASEVVLVE